jgi:hypothetical protein
MGCKDLLTDLKLEDFGNEGPKGNVYEITITKDDRIMVTIGDLSVLLTPSILLAEDKNGKRIVELEFHSETLQS